MSRNLKSKMKMKKNYSKSYNCLSNLKNKRTTKMSCYSLSLKSKKMRKKKKKSRSLSKKNLMKNSKSKSLNTMRRNWSCTS